MNAIIITANILLVFSHLLHAVVSLTVQVETQLHCNCCLLSPANQCFRTEARLTFSCYAACHGAGTWLTRRKLRWDTTGKLLNLAM